MSDRRRWATRLAPLALVAVLALALAVPSPDAIDLASPDRARVTELTMLLDELPAQPAVLVGFDPDIGTYAEVRRTVRVLLTDLVDRGARLTFVSLTPEGRALAVAELARLDRDGVSNGPIADLGFRPGAEAALVQLAREAAVRSSDLALVVGGNDVGPRMWVEQFAPRVPEVPLAAVAPTFLYPEAAPYLGSGQLAALLATVRDGASYRVALTADGDPEVLAFMAGMLVAAGVLVQALAARVLTAIRSRERRTG